MTEFFLQNQCLSLWTAFASMWRLLPNIKKEPYHRSECHSPPITEFDFECLRRSDYDGAGECRARHRLAEPLERRPLRAGRARTSFRDSRFARRVVSLVSRH